MKRHVLAHDPRVDNSGSIQVNWLQTRGGGERKRSCGDVKPCLGFGWDRVKSLEFRVFFLLESIAPWI